MRLGIPGGGYGSGLKSKNGDIWLVISSIGRYGDMEVEYKCNVNRIKEFEMLVMMWNGEVESGEVDVIEGGCGAKVIVICGEEFGFEYGRVVEIKYGMFGVIGEKLFVDESVVSEELMEKVFVRKEW